MDDDRKIDCLGISRYRPALVRVTIALDIS